MAELTSDLKQILDKIDEYWSEIQKIREQERIELTKILLSLSVKSNQAAFDRKEIHCNE